MTQKIAFVTGASRGIGKATVLALAKAGFDIAATARTRKLGDNFEHRVLDAEGRALPGSQEETAAAARGLSA